MNVPSYATVSMGGKNILENRGVIFENDIIVDCPSPELKRQVEDILTKPYANPTNIGLLALSVSYLIYKAIPVDNDNDSLVKLVSFSSLLLITSFFYFTSHRHKIYDFNYFTEMKRVCADNVPNKSVEIVHQPLIDQASQSYHLGLSAKKELRQHMVIPYSGHVYVRPMNNLYSISNQDTYAAFGMKFKGENFAVLFGDQCSFSDKKRRYSLPELINFSGGQLSSDPNAYYDVVYVKQKVSTLDPFFNVCVNALFNLFHVYDRIVPGVRIMTTIPVGQEILTKSN